MSAAIKAKPRHSKGIAIGALSSLLAFLFALAGYLKFASPEMAQHFIAWGYADWFRDLLGFVEIAAGVALLVRRTAFYAAATLMVVMVGAICTHLAHDEVPETLAPLVLLVLLAVVVYARRPRGI
jgi:putative oxidoreductase